MAFVITVLIKADLTVRVKDPFKHTYVLGEGSLLNGYSGNLAGLLGKLQLFLPLPPTLLLTTRPCDFLLVHLGRSTHPLLQRLSQPPQGGMALDRVVNHETSTRKFTLKISVQIVRNVQRYLILSILSPK